MNSASTPHPHAPPPSSLGTLPPRPLRTLSEAAVTVDISFAAGGDVVHCKVMPPLPPPPNFTHLCCCRIMIHVTGCSRREYISHGAQEQRRPRRRVRGVAGLRWRRRCALYSRVTLPPAYFTSCCQKNTTTKQVRTANRATKRMIFATSRESASAQCCCSRLMRRRQTWSD